MAQNSSKPPNSAPGRQSVPAPILGHDGPTQAECPGRRPGRRGQNSKRGNHGQLQAAASLIGDESPDVRQALLREFRRVGKAGSPFLRRAAGSAHAHIRSHARIIVDALARDEVLRRLARLGGRDHFDLESAFCLVARLERADLDLRPYRRALDAMGKEVRKRTGHLRDDLQKSQVLVHYLGTELGYRGDMQAHTHPDKVYLHRAIELKRGLPLTLCALYSFVAKRAGLQTATVPLPGHVMLRLYGRYQNLIVDPFHGGEARTQEELGAYLREHGLRFDPVWMHDASNKMLLVRQLANLQNALRAIDQPSRARDIDPLLTLMRR